MRSHNYRVPEPFRDQVILHCLLESCSLKDFFSPTMPLSMQNVVVVGMGASGIDIALEISHVAKEVHIASRYSEDRLGKVELCKNVWIHTEVQNSELFSSPALSPFKLTKSSLY